MSCVFLSTALKQLHGMASCDSEQEDIENERNNLVGFKPKKPWELFTDRSVRLQLLTIILLNTAQQLNGINAVCTHHDVPASIPQCQKCPVLTLQKCGIDLYRNNVRCAHFNQCLCLYLLQIYFYTDYVFRQAGIPDDKIPYATVGTGACECLTALTCVSFTVYLECLVRLRHTSEVPFLDLIKHKLQELV